MSQITSAVSGSSFLDINGVLNPGQTPQSDKAYMIDWTKLTSVNDLVLILSMLGIAFPGNHPGIIQIKQFLDFNSPIDISNAPTTQVGTPTPKGPTPTPKLK
jgi:hypothetical protein